MTEIYERERTQRHYYCSSGLLDDQLDSECFAWTPWHFMHYSVHNTPASPLVL